MGKIIVKSPDAVFNFVIHRKNATVKEFYDFVTFNGTQFNYDINSRGGRAGYTALHAACHNGNIPLVRALLLMGASPNVTTKGDGQYPLNIAIENGNFELVKLLVEYGARFDVYNDRFTTVSHYFHTCSDQGVREQIRELANAKPNKTLPVALKKDDQYYDITKRLEDMVEACDVDGARKLFADYFINLQDIFLVNTSLMKIAITKNSLEMVQLLAEQGDFLIEANVVYMSEFIRSLASALSRSHDDSDEKYRRSTDDDNAPHSNPELAKLLGHHEIAEFLEETQRSRYKKLEEAMQLEIAQKGDSVKLSQSNLFASREGRDAEAATSNLTPTTSRFSYHNE